MIPGNTIRLKAVFRDFDGLPVSPEDVLVRVYDGSMNIMLEETVLPVEVGRYQFDYTIPAGPPDPVFYGFSGVLDGHPIAGAVARLDSVEKVPYTTTNLQELLSRVMRALQHEIASSWGENDLVGLLNEGQNKLAENVNIFTTLTVGVPAGAGMVGLPDDLLHAEEVYFGGEFRRKLRLRNPRLPVNTTVTSTPMYYHLQGGYIHLHPIPDAADTLTLLYTQKPTPMVALVDTPHFKDSGEALIAFALHKVYLEQGDPATGTWDEVYRRELRSFLDGYDQNYQQPFQVRSIW